MAKPSRIEKRLFAGNRCLSEDANKADLDLLAEEDNPDYVMSKLVERSSVGNGPITHEWGQMANTVCLESEATLVKQSRASYANICRDGVQPFKPAFDKDYPIVEDGSFWYWGIPHLGFHAWHRQDGRFFPNF